MTTTAVEIDLVSEEPVFPENETGKRRRLDYLGYASCPIRAELRRRLHKRFTDYTKAGAPEIVWYMPAGCHTPNVYEELWMTQKAEDLPGLISETGFGDFNRQEFIRTWLDKGYYAPLSTQAMRPEFREAGLVDPQGIHYVYAANPEVVLVDMKRLGDRPVPKTWADVLHPRFKGDIIISGEAGDIHESLLFGIYRDFGEEGLAALGANVRDFMHPAEMAKAAGSLNPRGAAIYLLPEFFARSTPAKGTTRIVWPEEGAYLSPLYVLLRRDATSAARFAHEYLVGEEWARHLAKIGFAPALAGSPVLPGKLRWVGWDFVRTNDIEALRVPLNAAFVRGYKQ